jgi:hypothetical protein
MWLMQSSQQHLNQSHHLKPLELNLWNSLSAALKLTSEQKHILSSGAKTSILQGMESAHDGTIQMVTRLDELVSNKNESLDNEMSEIQGILSARQIAKFILWIDQNPACMQVISA